MAGGAAVVLVFVAYELIERLLLADAAMPTIHAAHVGRGIISSVAAAGLVGWVIARGSPSFLAPASSDAGRTALPPAHQERGDIEHYARWFIRMRTIAIVAAAAASFVAVKVTHILPEGVWYPLLGLIGLLVVSNVIYALLAKRGAARWHLSLQTYGDLVLLTGLLHLSGGVENPLWMLPLFHVVIAGVLLSPRECYLVAAVAAGLLGLTALAEWSTIVEHYALLTFPHGEHGDVHAAHQSSFVFSRVSLQSGMFVLVAYFVTSLAEHARNKDKRLAAMAEHAEAQRQLLEQALNTTRTALRVVGPSLQPEWTNNRWNEWFEPNCCLQSGAQPAPAVQTLSDGRVRVTEIAHETEDRQFQLTTAPIVDESGNSAQVAQIAQDITEQKRAQDQMIRAGKMAAVGELAGRLAHEINNPIAIVSAKARLLLSGHREHMSNKVATELDKIVNLADRVAGIAQGLLSYCRPGHAPHSLVDLRTAVQGAIGMIDDQARSGGVRIEEQLGPAGSNVRGNAGELGQVFLNLMLNALTAMPNGGKLMVRALDEPGSLADGRVCTGVVIEDTGTGIAPEILQKVWEPFFSTKEDGKGTGLGLSVCVGLVESHGGTIEVESHRGCGSRFTVRLPLAANERRAQ